MIVRSSIKRCITLAVLALCWVGAAQAQIDQVTELPLPQIQTVQNQASELTLQQLYVSESIAGAVAVDNHQFLIVEVELKNTIGADLVFDHDVPEEIVFHNFGVHGPVLQWGSENVFARVKPDRVNTGELFPDPAVLSFAGDSLRGQFVFEIPQIQPDSSATLIWPQTQFDTLTLELIGQPAQQAGDSTLFSTNGDFNLLTGYRTATSPSVKSETGSALPISNLSGARLFVDGASVEPDFGDNPASILFVANRTLTYQLWFPVEDLAQAIDVGLVLPTQPPKAQSNEPYWIFNLQGDPSISRAGTPTLEQQSDNTDQEQKQQVEQTDNPSPGLQFSPSWPEPPVAIELHDLTVPAAIDRLNQLASDNTTEITTGAELADAVALPIDQAFKSQISEADKRHVFVLEPPTDQTRLTELLVWSADPKALKIELLDMVEGESGVKLLEQSSTYPLTRLLIQKPALLALNKSKRGSTEYRLLWRYSQPRQAGLEHEPNSIRHTQANLVSLLPVMEQLSEFEYGISGYTAEQDKFDHFVLESGVAALVTLEASAGKVGTYAGSTLFESRVVDKRRFLADVLLLPGKNVFSFGRHKGDYSIRATLTPLNDRWHELEPNDKSYLAHRLLLEKPRTGRLPAASDSDFYFFNWNTTGEVRLTAQAGDGGDLSLRIDKAGTKLKTFNAAEVINETLLLEPGTYEILLSTRKPSLQPYTVSVAAQNPIAVAKPNDKINLSVESLTNQVQPFYEKGQVINAVLRIENKDDTRLDSTLQAHSSHNSILIDIPISSVSVAAGQSAEVPVAIRIKRLSNAFGDVPLYFSIDGDGGGASTQWNLHFPYGAAPADMVWHDQPLPTALMGAFDVARLDFGASVHREITCRCTSKLVKNGRVYGTDAYHFKSGLCASAVHAGVIDAEGGVINATTVPMPASYIGSERNGIKSTDTKRNKPAFSFLRKPNATTSDTDDCVKTPKENFQGSDDLIDGYAFQGFFKGESVAVNLVGDKPVELAGVVLSLRGTKKNQVRQFEIEISTDGVQFQSVYTGVLELNAEQQPFVFTDRVEAAYVRVRLLSGFNNEKPQDLALGSLKVLAKKNQDIAEFSHLNLADPALGGHVFSNTPEATVLAFHHNRLALIDEISIESKERKTIASVAIQVSEEGPYGPWTVVANVQINPKSSRDVTLDEPLKARFVKLSGNWTKADRVVVSSVREVANSDSYRSILAEWGNQESEAYFELGLEPEPNVAASSVVSSKESPYEVNLNQKISSLVSLPQGLSDFFRIPVPENTLSLQLRFNGDVRRMQVDITDEAGNPVEYVVSSNNDSRSAVYTVSPLLDVSGLLVKVHDIPKHLAILWDDSGSVSSYVPGLHRMLRNFAFDVDSRFEKINLMSLRDKKPRFLLENWASNPFELLGAIQSYVSTGSSKAYINMEYALNKLNDVDGIKALLIMTDEKGDRNQYKHNKMEELLRDSGVSVFSFHATSSKLLHDINANRMQAWANIADGRYSLIRSKEEVPDAIAKVQTWLRKPAAYEMQAIAIENKPGTLAVVSKPDVNGEKEFIASGAVEVILDASGSMWKKMADGQARITVAKDVLLSLVSEKLPENLPFAMRVFGNRRAKSCRTDLEIAFGPLSRKKAISTIKKINPQDRSKTPIGDSLAAVAKDLKNAEGKKIVILVTDGEETCGADPKAVVADLVAQGIEVQVNIVGFAIDDDGLKAEFAEWAAVGGGDYFDTNDAEQLIESLQESLTPTFNVTNANGELVAQGRMDGPSLQLLPGDYSVQLSVDGYEPKTITVLPGSNVSVNF